MMFTTDRKIVQLCFKCSDKKLYGYISAQGVFEREGTCGSCGKNKPIVLFMSDFSYMTYHLVKRIGFYACILGKGMNGKP